MIVEWYGLKCVAIGFYLGWLVTRIYYVRKYRNKGFEIKEFHATRK